MNNIIRDFKHHYHKTRKLLPELAAQGSFTFNLNWKEEELSASTSTPSREKSIQFAVLMCRFLDSKSDLYYEKIFEFLKSNAPQILTEERQNEIRSYIESMKRGAISFQIDGKNLTAEEIYSLVSDGKFFREEQQIANYLMELSAAPIVEPLFWHQFYSYTLDSFYLVSALFDLIIELQKNEFTEADQADANTRVGQCIYCLSSNDTFRSEEHVFPEGLGNDSAVLPKGFVCENCNNGVLSERDSYLLKFEPVAFCVVQYVPYTKSGQLPKANFQNMTIEKAHPRHIRITAKDKTGGISNKQELGDGWFSWNLNFRGKVFDPERLGRSLYKIGLGFVALDQGQEAALSNRFNLARDYIMGRSGFPNYMLMSTNVHPHPGFRVTHKDIHPGCPFVIDIFGIIFMFNLEAQPIVEPHSELVEQGFQKYWLENETIAI
jgi:hypothetical protein